MKVGGEGVDAEGLEGGDVDGDADAGLGGVGLKVGEDLSAGGRAVEGAVGGLDGDTGNGNLFGEDWLADDGVRDAEAHGGVGEFLEAGDVREEEAGRTCGCPKES